MGRTEVFTGSKRSQDKKTAALRVKSGRAHPGTSETGETTARKDSEFNTTKTETSTRACGCATGGTDKVPTGETKVEN
jgi:hypothetical protein